MDFLEPKLESYLSTEVRKSELTRLQAGPVLFHSGYLTLDKISRTPQAITSTKETKSLKSYSFRLPNYEVSSSYYADCFSVILELESITDLKPKSEALRAAFLARNADVVASVFSDYFSSLTSFQRPKDEKTIHANVQLILKALDFEIHSEEPGHEGRPDLYLKLSDQVYLVIEIKYCPDKRRRSNDDKIEALAKAARTRLPVFMRNAILAKAIENKLSPFEFDAALSKSGKAELTEEEKNQILAGAVSEYLTEAEYSTTLAEAIKKELGKEEIKEILKNAARTSGSPSERIDKELSEAAELALRSVTDKYYHDVIISKAVIKPKEIIDLGLAVYGGGKKVLAAFGPK
jgi:hypothetical protein